MFKFDPRDATVRIRILPHRYVQVNGKDYAPVPVTELDQTGKKVRKWDYSNAELAVTPEVAEHLTTSSEEEQMRGIQPVAVLLGAVQAKPEPKAAEPQRRKAE